MQRFDPIVIYQMGKVGSTTIKESLKRHNLSNEHIHFLSWNNIAEVEKYYLGLPHAKVPKHIERSKRLRSFIDNTWGKIRWKVITMVREPVGRDISDFFQNMGDALPHVRDLPEDKALREIIRHLLGSFSNFNETKDYVCTWFDKEIKDVFNFDIYAHDFNKTLGYQIYEAANADILLIRLEDLSRCCHDAFREFLGVPDFSMVKDNVGEKKWYQGLYRRVLDSISIPDSDLERIYKSRYCRHFYTGDEINHFKKKWSGEKTEIKSVTVASSQRNSSNSGKILIVHPEGNINNNPNLSGIVQILCENGYKVDIYSLRRPNVYQHSPCAGVSMFLFDRVGVSVESGIFILADQSFNSPQQMTSYLNENFNGYDLVIGVDRGIIEAALIAQNKNIPYGLISYEIFFGEETGSEFKLPEIKACKWLDFAVCQDELRAKYLSIENKIDLEKIINIPVAGRGIKKGEKNSYLYDSLGIDKDKKIALFMGTVAQWSMADYILESAKLWSEDWVLVVHSRYGLDQGVRPYYAKYKCSDNIYFSLEPIADFNQLDSIIHSADVGIAFYEPTYQCKYTGNNIKYLGMASGKIATYLQHGLPIIINEIGRMSEHVREYKLGLVIDDKRNLNTSLTDGRLLKFRLNCLEFFEKRLDLNHTIVPLLKIMQRLFDKQTLTVSSENSLALGTKDFLDGKVEHPVINSAEKYNLSGEELLGRKDIDGALNAFKKAIEVAPHFIAAHNKEAKKLYVVCLQKNPNDYEIIQALKSLDCKKPIEARNGVVSKDKISLTAATQSVVLGKMQTQNEYPRISIITPSYNQGQFVEKCISSILSQNYPNLEYIVIDGGSTDNSVEVIKRYEDRISYWVSEKDTGQADAINKGLKVATGEIFNWINSDDYLEPGALFKVAQAYQKNPEAVGWMGACRRVEPDGRVINVVYPNSLNRDNLGQNWNGRQFYQPSGFLRTDIARRVGGMNTNFHFAFDMDLCLRMLTQGEFVVAEGTWSCATIHPDAKTQQSRKQMFTEQVEIQKMHGFVEGAANRFGRNFLQEKHKWIPPRNIAGKLTALQGCNRLGRPDFIQDSKIVVMGRFLPRFDRTSGDLRVHHILKTLLSSGYEVDYLYSKKTNSQEKYKHAYTGRINFIQLPDEIEPITEYLATAGQLEFVWMTCIWNVHPMRVALDVSKWIRENMPRTRIIIDTMDFHYKKFLRKYQCSGDPEALTTSKQFLELERELYPLADKVVAISDIEKKDIAANIDLTKEITVIPNIHHIPQTSAGFSERKNICFLGYFKVDHNVDAVRYFLKDIFPAIREKNADVEFHILGYGSEDYREQFEQNANVKVIGYVEDAESAISGYRLFICPMTYGAGMKGKIGVAAATGTPIVTTTIGSEGGQMPAYFEGPGRLE